MALDDRDYMRRPENEQPGSGTDPESTSGGSGRRGFNIDSGLLIGIALVVIGLAALLITGFGDSAKNDPYLEEMAFYDPEYNGGYPQLDVNSATREELALLPMMSERIVDGIIKRREERPFKMSEELLEVPGVGEINMEFFLMYLYGFEDIPEPREHRKPPGIPDA